jgi:hypothetical protein
VHDGGGPAGRHDRTLNLLGTQSGDGRRYRVAIMGAEHLLNSGTVMGVIGVQPDPPVGRAIVTGDRVPQRRLGPVDRGEQSLGRERGACCPAVNRHHRQGRFPARGEQPGSGQRGDPHRAGRQPGHVERGWQDCPWPGRLQLVGHALGPVVSGAGRVPQAGDHIAEVVVHSIDS